MGEVLLRLALVHRRPDMVRATERNSAMNSLPGGGEFGRGARREVRNPVLLLPAARGILELPIESRRPLGILLRQLSDQAAGQAQISWKQNKGIMAAYWKAVSVYAKHLARVIDPISARAPSSLSPHPLPPASSPRTPHDSQAGDGADTQNNLQQEV